MRVYSPRRSAGKKRFAFFITLGLAAVILGGVAFGYTLLRDLPNPQRISERTVIESTKIYDRTGKILLYEVHGEEKRTVVALSEIPLTIQQATLAAEDINFYSHRGIDAKGILRAAYTNLIRGDIRQGGSTITQQLIKNSILGSERTFRRKIREQILALLLEQKYSKDEILELYLNQIPYGSNAYGVAAAAQTFFGKEPKDVAVGEAALLAALPKAPTYYSPYGAHRDELLTRRDRILDRMADAGFVSKEEVARVKNAPLSFVPPRQSLRAPHFVMFIQDYLREKYGEEYVEQGGLRVTTTLDWELQEKAEQIVREGAEQNEKLVGAGNAALVALDPATGEILAMVGSRDFFADPKPAGCRPGINCRLDPQVNVALRARQPGSAFKPFVYATAFAKGYTPETVLFDVPTEFNVSCGPDALANPSDGRCYHPRNYDGTFRGPVTLRQALGQSLNVPSVKLLYLAGVGDSITTAKNMGITTLTDPDRYGLALVLGGGEVTLFEMTSAFGVFAKEGIRHPATGILKVQSARGEVLEEKKDAAIPVLDTEVARTINILLSDNDARVPVFSPRSSLYFPNRDVAAKTGTTQDYRDAWVIGYTPSVVAGVWVGNNDNSAMSQNSVSIMVAGPVWHRFMEAAMSRVPPESFTPPSGVNAPPESRPLPSNWGAAVETWLAAHPGKNPQGLTELSAPIETNGNTPAITFTSPLESEKEVAAPLAAITARISSPAPVREAILFINDEMRGSRVAPGDIVSFPLSPPLGPGTYRVKITVYGAERTQGEATHEITVRPSGE